MPKKPSGGSNIRRPRPADTGGGRREQASSRPTTVGTGSPNNKPKPNQ